MKNREVISSHGLLKVIDEKFADKLKQILDGEVLYKARDGRVLDFGSGAELKGPRRFTQHTLE
jgi:hypothetical protein